MRNVCIAALSAANTADATGAKIDANQLINASFQPVFADVTATGTVKIQASNDPTLGVPRDTFTPVNWSDVPNATAAVASGVAPMITLADMAYSYIRVVYTRTNGGSSTVTVNMNAVGV